MGITQSDEYADVYDRFMEEYNEGKPLPDIKQDILEDYLMEFEEDDGILHDVYFAIGKAEWMCGGISEDMFGKISHIIASGANIAFLRELEASERDLKQRQKNLEKFLSSLSVPREKAKKRKIPTEKYVKKPKLPQFRPGDVFAYEFNGKYRLFCLITKEKHLNTQAAFCYLWTRLFDQIPTIDELTEEAVIPLGRFTAGTFPKIEQLKYVGNYPAMAELNMTNLKSINESWKYLGRTTVTEADLQKNCLLEMGMPLKDCLEKIELLKTHSFRYALEHE